MTLRAPEREGSLGLNPLECGCGFQSYFPSNREKAAAVLGTAHERQHTRTKRLRTRHRVSTCLRKNCLAQVSSAGFVRLLINTMDNKSNEGYVRKPPRIQQDLAQHGNLPSTTTTITLDYIVFQDAKIIASVSESATNNIKSRTSDLAENGDYRPTISTELQK
ncbi:hypothetical protein CHS0354_007258 [Potamilus streckersoni]|uniref:Uncharacterized protein n=1 Tax=Potamilus streckersoni TaxID=2493646 RepID=A0AAE0TE58_9BIVA|nr:hypothetical protein CHS0354_007258 [Potamilus streckersoni]